MDHSSALKVVTGYNGLEEDKERHSGEIVEIQTECAPLVEQIKQLNSKMEEFYVMISRKKDELRKIHATLELTIEQFPTRIIEERKEMKKLRKYAVV
jgi:chromosome segregation ATPase